MSDVFVDTSAFYALLDKRDRNHARAKIWLTAATKARHGLVTSTYVLDEALTLIRVRIDHAAALRFGQALRATAWCRTVDVTDTARDAAWELFARYSDHVFSFTDCTSFALMHALGISEAFTFDARDFGAAGFVAVPRAR